MYDWADLEAMREVDELTPECPPISPNPLGLIWADCHPSELRYRYPPNTGMAMQMEAARQHALAQQRYQEWTQATLVIPVTKT